MAFKVDVGVDTKQLREMGKNLKKIKPEIHRAIQRELRSEAKKLQAEVIQEASFSQQIPPTVTASVSGITNIIIRAGKKGSFAKAVEHAGKEGEFRHPLFGYKKLWYPQKAHPYIHPVVLRNLHRTTGVIAAAITVAAKEAMRVK